MNVNVKITPVHFGNGLKINGKRGWDFERNRDDQDKEIGWITSGSFSPSLGCGIALGYVEPSDLKKDLAVSVQDKNVNIEAVITERPLLTKTSLRR